MDLMSLPTDLRRILQAPDGSPAIGRLELAGGADVDPVCAMIDRHEGGESAALARRWFAEQPHAWYVVRDSALAPIGTMCLLAVPADPPTTREGAGTASESDPAIAAARRQLRSHPPLRPGERVTLVRFWLSDEHYQSISPVQSLITTQLLRHYLTTPGLAVSLLPFAHPQEWSEACAYTDQRRAPEADFMVGGRQYATFVHDWRVVTPPAWVAALSAREIGAQLAGGPPMPVIAVLTRDEFATAVKSALRDVTRPDRLRDNPLQHSRLVTGREGDAASAADRVSALQAILRDAVAELSTTQADKRLARVLHRAYLSPAPTLERAAEVLDLPSSTFRRLLTAGVGRVVDILWHREIDA